MKECKANIGEGEHEKVTEFKRAIMDCEILIPRVHNEVEVQKEGRMKAEKKVCRLFKGFLNGNVVENVSQQ